MRSMSECSTCDAVTQPAKTEDLSAYGRWCKADQRTVSVFMAVEADVVDDEDKEDRTASQRADQASRRGESETTLAEPSLDAVSTHEGLYAQLWGVGYNYEPHNEEHAVMLIVVYIRC